MGSGVRRSAGRASVETIADQGVLAPAPVADTHGTLPATGGGSVLVSGIALALGAGFRRRG